MDAGCSEQKGHLLLLTSSEWRAVWTVMWCPRGREMRTRGGGGSEEEQTSRECISAALPNGCLLGRNSRLVSVAVTPTRSKGGRPRGVPDGACTQCRCRVGSARHAGLRGLRHRIPALPLQGTISPSPLPEVRRGRHAPSSRPARRADVRARCRGQQAEAHAAPRHSPLRRSRWTCWSGTGRPNQPPL